MNRRSFWMFIMITIILVIIFWNAGGSRVKDLAPFYFKKIIGETAEVEVGGFVVDSEVASTPSARQKGLSGRDYLQLDKGMLFVFPEADIWQFTMANTNFPLDIIWILDDRIVDIAHAVRPGEDMITTSAMANYVLEIRASIARQQGWQVGDIVNIEF